MRIPPQPFLNLVSLHPFKLKPSKPDFSEGFSQNLRLPNMDGGFQVSTSLKEFGDEIDYPHDKQEVKVEEGEKEEFWP